MPLWLQDVLINNFHLITEVGMWAQAKPPIGDWCQPEDGLWGLNECPRGCPQIECGGNTYYGGMAEQYFFPQLVKSTLRTSPWDRLPIGLSKKPETSLTRTASSILALASARPCTAIRAKKARYWAGVIFS